MWEGFVEDVLLLLAAFLLVLLNAFFVAAEFALVKIRRSRVKVLIRKGRPFAKTTGWLAENLNSALSACQLGITIASLGLGWIGEPAVAELLRPLLHGVGIESEETIHWIALVVAFSLITAAHIVAGELAPKQLAITKTEFTALACSLPLRTFYIITYPFVWVLNHASDLLLKTIGLYEAGDPHETAMSEEELKITVRRARAGGRITKRTSDLLEGIFNLENRVTRQIMVPRPDVVFFRVDQRFAECLEMARRTKHTRFPLCEDSLDDAVGVIHMKDFLDHLGEDEPDLRAIARPSRFVPETLSVSLLLKRFQASRQHMAFVLDEHGAVQGIVTLENALEELIGEVQDEFDQEEPRIIPDGRDSFIVSGQTPLGAINKRLGTKLTAHHVDTLSGLLFREAGRVLKTGDRIELPGVAAEVTEIRASRAFRVRLTLPSPRRSRRPG